MDFRNRLKNVDEVKTYAALLQEVPESTTREVGSSQVSRAAVFDVIAHRVLSLLCKFLVHLLGNPLYGIASILRSLSSETAEALSAN